MLQKPFAASQRHNNVGSSMQAYALQLQLAPNCLLSSWATFIYTCENVLQCPFMIIIIAGEAATYACRQKLLVAATRRYNAHVAWIQAQLRKLNDSPLSLLMSMSWMASNNSSAYTCQGLVHLPPFP